VRVRLRNPEREVSFDGARTVAELLAELGIAPHTVLVLAGGQLVTAGHELDADADVEVRPVISGGAGASNCVVCRGAAVIEEPRHRSAWCAEHFVEHVRGQVRKAIDRPGSGSDRMFHYGERLLVAVSGGKDSLALWDVLLDLGYEAEGLYIGLGIGGYSSRSLALVEAFAKRRGARLIVEDLGEDYGFTTPQAASLPGRSTCGLCGLSKRYVFNRVAVREGHDVVVTGHNLDDEAATLLGNLLRWNDPLLARQRPALPSGGANLVRRAKPLYRLSEREMAAYCVVRGIDYVVEECPLVAGNTGMELKAALDLLEAGAPGTKAQLLFGFLERRDAWYPVAEDALEDGPIGARADLVACSACGMPTTSPDRCAFCRERDRLTAGRAVPALPILTAATSPRPAP
jgi:tRNA-5-methyluridine54 2-sulfurtransferase